jgi:hypothetical protein
VEGIAPAARPRLPFPHTAETYSEPDHHPAYAVRKTTAVEPPRTPYNPRASMALTPGARLGPYEIVSPAGPDQRPRGPSAI